MVDKALGLAPDALVLDLEDGVPPTMKDAARGIVAEAVGRPRKTSAARFVRVNPREAGSQEVDLAAVVSPGLDAIVLPKVEQVAEVQAVDVLLTRAEGERNMKAGTIKLVVSIESARGV